MTWSLTHHQTQEPERLEEFLLSVGKALYLACSFEGKCRYLLQMLKMAEEYELTGDWKAAKALITVLDKKMLGRAIKDLAACADACPADIILLEAAREARNAIAHRVAEMAPTSSISAKELAERTEELRRHVATLTAGDNLVSRWCYEFEEHEAAPKQIQELYPSWIMEWVFGDDDV